MRSLRYVLYKKVWLRLRLHRHFGMHKRYPPGCPCLSRKQLKALRARIADGTMSVVKIDPRYVMPMQKTEDEPS